MTDHPLSTARRPQGQLTRGKTAANRLRRIDALVALHDGELLRRRGGLFRNAIWVDLGFGNEPGTTLDCHRRWRRLAPDLAVLGVEIDRQRVERARVHAGPGIAFRHGGFELPIGIGADGKPERVRLIRAFNVLRQYSESEVAPALCRLARHVLAGGLLVEGTSDPFGRHWVTHLYRRTVLDWAEAVSGNAEAEAMDGLWKREALVFGTNFEGWEGGLDPMRFQAVLPKDLIHRVVPGEPIHDFIEAWRIAVAETRAVAAFGRRQHFVAAARRLAAKGFSVDPRRRFVGRGFLLWRWPELRRDDSRPRR